MEYIDLIPNKEWDVHEFGKIIHENTHLYNEEQLQALYVIWMIEYEKYLKGLVKKANVRLRKKTQFSFFYYYRLFL